MGKSQRGQRCAKHGAPKTVNYESRWMCVYCRAAMNDRRAPAKDIPKDAREVYLGDDGEPIAYCPKDSLGLTDIQRGMFFGEQRERLAQLQARAREKTRAGEPCVAVAIDVDDATWTSLVDMLMPGHDWQQYRARGETPVARGVVPREPMERLVAKVYPAAGEFGAGSPILVFAAGGVAVIRDQIA